MHIQDAFLNLADSSETLTCIEADGTRSATTYPQLLDDALRLLGGLQSEGIPSGTPILLQIKGIYLQLTAFWACILGGYVPAILPLVQDEKSRSSLENVLQILEAPRILSDLTGITALPSKETIMLQALSVKKRGDWVAGQDTTPGMLQFTSGTTDAPKAAVLTLKNLYEGGVASCIVTRKGISERYLNWLPLSHCFGFIGYHIVPIVGNFSQMQLHPSCFIRDPSIFLHQISDFKATITGLPLFGVEALLKLPLEQIEDLSSLHVCFCGGEDINPQSLIALEARLAPFGWKPHSLCPAYGLSETTMGVAYTPVASPLRVDTFLSRDITIGGRLYFCDPDEDTTQRVSVGVLDACNTVVIRDLSGMPLPENHLGIIYIRGSNVMAGYYAADSNYTGIDPDGFFCTGDLGYFHKGWLTIFGRLKNIVIINGVNYLLTDLEKTAQLDCDPATAPVLVQGRLHGESDNSLVAFSTGSKIGLTNFNENLSKYWYLSLRCGIIIDSIPRTASGKVDRLALTLALERGDFDDSLLFFEHDTHEIPPGPYYDMALLWSAVLSINIERISLESHFIFDCGGDSLTLTDLLWRLEKNTGQALAARHFVDALTLKKMTDILGELTHDD